MAESASWTLRLTIQFDREYIKGMHPSLGLRTPTSITAMAEKWGFRMVKQEQMPKGNLWIVWEAAPVTAVM